jgi:hypothetical protein
MRHKSEFQIRKSSVDFPNWTVASIARPSLDPPSSFTYYGEHPERAVLAHGPLYTPIPNPPSQSLQPGFSLTTSCSHFSCSPLVPPRNRLSELCLSHTFGFHPVVSDSLDPTTPTRRPALSVELRPILDIQQTLFPKPLC